MKKIICLLICCMLLLLVDVNASADYEFCPECGDNLDESLADFKNYNNNNDNYEEVNYEEDYYEEDYYEEVNYEEDYYEEDYYDEEYNDEGYYEEDEYNTEFTDEIPDASEWARGEIEAAGQYGVIPDELADDALYGFITREEFAAVAVKLYEIISGEYLDYDIKQTPFTDCEYDGEFAGYIAAAYELGITKGTHITKFSPHDRINREQLSTMLFRVLELVEKDDNYIFDEKNIRMFYDDTDIPGYAKRAVYFMADNGIIKGVDSVHFAPLENATKEQAIIIAYRCINNL